MLYQVVAPVEPLTAILALEGFLGGVERAVMTMEMLLPSEATGAEVACKSLGSDRAKVGTLLVVTSAFRPHRSLGLDQHRTHRRRKAPIVSASKVL